MTVVEELQIDWEPTFTRLLREVDGWRLVEEPPMDRWAISHGRDLFAEREEEIRERVEREAKGGGGWIHDWLMSMVPTADGKLFDGDDMRTLVSPDGAQWRCWAVRPGDDSPGWMDETHWDRAEVDEMITARELYEQVPVQLRGFVAVQTRAAMLSGMYDLPTPRSLERALGGGRHSLYGAPFNGVIEVGLALDWLRDEQHRRRPRSPETFRFEGPNVHFCGEYPSIVVPDGKDWWNFTLGVRPFACGGRLTWFETHVSLSERRDGSEARTVRHGWRCDWCERVSYGPRPDELEQNYTHGSCAPARQRGRDDA